MNRDLMDFPWVRRLVKAYVAAMTLSFIALSVWHGFILPRWTARWEAALLGQTESQGVARLGKPSYEDRDPRAPSREFSLAWTDRLGMSVHLEFKNGVVVKRTRSSR